ncbi:MAG: hypothetical protein IJA90_11440 [Peptococcaceae bacterium]|nr:hypothetical protein [Peptococcaceae bacterium]
MATSYLIKSSTTVYTHDELLLYLNNARKANYESLVEALAGLAAGVVGLAVKKDIVSKIAGAIGIGISIAGLEDIIASHMEATELEAYLPQVDENHCLYITTYLYEWLSGSGNHTAYYTENDYAIR